MAPKSRRKQRASQPDFRTIILTIVGALAAGTGWHILSNEKQDTQQGVLGNNVNVDVGTTKTSRDTSDSPQTTGNNNITSTNGSTVMRFEGPTTAFLTQTTPASAVKVTSHDPIADLLGGDRAAFPAVCSAVRADPKALQDLCAGARVAPRDGKTLALEVLEQLDDPRPLDECSGFLRNATDEFAAETAMQKRLVEFELRAWARHAKANWLCAGEMVIRTRDPKHPSALALALVSAARANGIPARISSRRAAVNESTRVFGESTQGCADAAAELAKSLRGMRLGGTGLLLPEGRTTPVLSKTPQVDVLLGGGM